MQIRQSLYVVIFLLLSMTCGTPTGNEQSKSVDITGRVLNNTTRAPMRNVIVRVLEPRPEKYTVTDSLGRYGITIKVDSLTQVRMQFASEGFTTLERSFLAVPDRDVPVTDVLLVSTTGSGGQDDDDVDSGEGASIRLVGVSSSIIAVSQTGGIEQSVLTFVVTDSTGLPLDNTTRATVTFRLGASPGGGESLSPATATTNAQGRVSTTLTSGTVSGVVQVIAESINSANVVQRSKPASVTISSGLPDQNHFSVKTDGRTNYRFNNGTATLASIPVTAFVGDRYGNFVGTGTPVYFTTSGGTIGATASTNASGQAATGLLPVSPYPTHPILGSGFATIRARTADWNNQTIEATKTILFSDNTVVTTSRESLSLSRGGSETVTYTVSDQHGNPLVQGTQITVTANNTAMSLRGDLNVTLDDTQAKGAGTTQFSFTASYPEGGTEAIEATNVVVTVTSPNGNATKTLVQPKIFAGASGGVGGSAASISLASVSQPIIVVRQSGGIEQSVLTFVVNDSSGKAINLSNAIEVDFSLLVNPGGSALVFPLKATTDEQGRVSTTITSGTTSGVVQVGALATRGDGLILRSNPASVTISGGMPDANHFSVKTDGRTNYRFNNGTSTLVSIPITAFVGDRYGNFVPSGTPIYFTTNGGNIGANASTNASGQASTSLVPVNPYPTDPILGAGFTTVRARTVDWNNQSIEATKTILFSDNTVLTTSRESLTLSRGSTETVTYTVSDQHGNPLVQGTQITVTANNPAMTLRGDLSVTLGDTQAKGVGTTQFSFAASYPEGGTEAIEATNVVVTVTSPNGNATKTLVQPKIFAGASGGVGGTAASITLATVSHPAIVVRQSGGIEQSVLTFVVRDSSGKAINLSNAIEVDFSLLVNPGGTALIFPLKATTDEQGRVTTTITSGTTSGVVQVSALATRGDGLILRSNPASITIRGGMPHADNFSLKSDRVNYRFNHSTATLVNIPITAFVGDRYGNFVPSGTPIYFTTNGGNIGADATTNTEGRATTVLTPVNPYPVGGIARVRARTVDWLNQTIETTLDLMFSDNTTITAPSTLNLTRGGSETVNYTVADQHGNPLVAGTTITVTTTNPIMVLNGYTNVILGDSRVNGTGITAFSFTASYPAGGSEAIAEAQVVITVTSPNGNATKTLVQPPIAEGATGGTGGAAVSISLEAISSTQIRVKETGGVEQATLTFRVRDAQGNPVDVANQVEVDFSTVVSPGGGVQIFPLTATTDDQGRVRTTVTSGTVSGVVQVRAQIDGPPILRSNPVQIVIHAGLPDANHFSVSRNTFNMPGGVVFGLTNTITAFVGDRYGNPVENGTAVYFTTDGGIIQGAGFTTNGITSATLTTAAPFPSAVHPSFGRSGYATIRARTADWNSQSIEATTTVLFSAGASINVTSGAVINVTHGPGPGHKVEYTVADANGNPLAPGTAITVTVEGQEINVIGDVNITLPDVLLPGQGVTQFAFTVSDANFNVDAERPVQVTIKVSGPNGNITRTLTGASFKSLPGQ